MLCSKGSGFVFSLGPQAVKNTENEKMEEKRRAVSLAVQDEHGELRVNESSDPAA